jgi:hypothetical protein
MDDDKGNSMIEKYECKSYYDNIIICYMENKDRISKCEVNYFKIRIYLKN